MRPPGSPSQQPAAAAHQLSAVAGASAAQAQSRPVQLQPAAAQAGLVRPGAHLQRPQQGQAPLQQGQARMSSGASLPAPADITAGASRFLGRFMSAPEKAPLSNGQPKPGVNRATDDANSARPGTYLAGGLDRFANLTRSFTQRDGQGS